MLAHIFSTVTAVGMQVIGSHSIRIKNICVPQLTTQITPRLAGGPMLDELLPATPLLGHPTSYSVRDAGDESVLMRNGATDSAPCWL